MLQVLQMQISHFVRNHRDATGAPAQNGDECKDDHVHSAYTYRVRIDHCTQGGVTIIVSPTRS